MLTAVVYFLVAAYALQAVFCVIQFFTAEGSPYSLVTGGLLGLLAGLLHYTPGNVPANIVGFIVSFSLLLSIVSVTENSYGVDRKIGKFNAVITLVAVIVFAIRVFS